MFPDATKVKTNLGKVSLGLIYLTYPIYLNKPQIGTRSDRVYGRSSRELPDFV